MDDRTKAFLFDLLGTPSPTGFELPGVRKWAEYVREFADRVENDAYGSAWATIDGRTARSRRIMLEAHADEIGFIIKHINKEGFLRLDRIGGSDTATARGRRLFLLGDKGPVAGVIGNTAIHLRKGVKEEKVPQVHELYVDVGASNAIDVRELGLRVGHPAVYAERAEEFGKHRIVGRALDNRIGGFIIARVLAALADKRAACASAVFAVNAVQEEIGGHGAKMIAHRLNPDLCLVVDVTHATDTPGIEVEKHGEVKLGAGPSITHGSANHPRVVQRIIEVANEHGIPLQHESSARHTGTDADSVFNVREGIPSALVSLPLRYMHSVVEIADLRDIEQTILLLTNVILSIADADEFAVSLAL